VGEITKGQCKNTKYMKWICGLEDRMVDDVKVTTVAPFDSIDTTSFVTMMKDGLVLP
jgi:hypothetical protein